MPYLNGFEAAIRVKNGELPIYGIHVDEAEKIVTCWIPSQAGQKFTVSWKVQKNVMDSRGDVFFDGIEVGSEIIRKSFRVKKRGGDFSSANKSKVKTQDQKPFTFPTSDYCCPISSTNSNTACKHEIRLVINRISNFSSSKCDGEPVTDERSGHRYRLRNTTEDRIATFIFKYRPFDLLSFNGILSREPVHRPALPALVSGNSVPMHYLLDGSTKAEFSSQDEEKKGNIDQTTPLGDQEIELEICNLQTRLNELHAIKLYRARLAGIGRLRRPQDAPNTDGPAKATKRNLERSTSMNDLQEPAQKRVKVESTK